MKLAPNMGKQLLILMTLIAGGGPTKSQGESLGDDLKVAAFDCMSALIECMGKLQQSKHIFDEVDARTMVDQSTYILLEAITDNPSDLVQLAAAQALSSLFEQVSDRIVLASLMPRTVSSLTKALQLSTQARRTHRVLQVHLATLNKILYKVLNDEVVENEADTLVGTKRLPEATPEREADKLSILDKSWLQATSSQVRLALISVAKLRDHDRAEVRQALVRLATMVINQCSKTLAESVSPMIETLVVLANDRVSTTAFHVLKRLASIDPGLGESLKTSLYKWTGSLPRVMQGSDDRPKSRILQQISTTFEVLSEIDQSSDILDTSLATNLVESVATAIGSQTFRSVQAVTEPAKPSFNLLNIQEANSHADFEAVVLNHGSQKELLAHLHTLIAKLGRSQNSDALVRLILDRVASSGSSKVAATWLALNLLRQRTLNRTSMEQYLDLPGDAATAVDTRPHLVSDLYALAVSELLDPASYSHGTKSDWRLTALALESLILQANQLGPSYRPELVETLYPILSLLGASQLELRTHAITSLNLLAKACHYSSTSDMLVQNADYLINSVALRLNAFDISPQAPQVFLMMVRLCGAKLIPYLDDLIYDIFAILDSFHGYPRLVEVLVEVFDAVVDEGARQLNMDITSGNDQPGHKKQHYQASTIEDILADLVSYNVRKNKTEAEYLEPMKSAPHRPWSDALDGPDRIDSTLSNPVEGSGHLAEEQANENLPPSEKEQTLSKTHSLLLRIAESTPYHLSSPSPRVRLIVLHLLARIATPLSVDENTFLPLINADWPALAPRLFANSHTTDDITEDGGRSEPAYITMAAANTVSALCVGAGDFMASRIEDIFPSLEKTYRQVWDRVASRRGREKGRQRDQRIRRLNGAHIGPGLEGAVDLRITQTNLPSTSLQSTKVSVDTSLHDGINSSDEQILNALIGLLVVILDYVRISDDMGDTILDLLAPIMDEPGREAVRAALDVWNADAVWLVRDQMRCLAEERG